jgi:hypothetical protein
VGINGILRLDAVIDVDLLRKIIFRMNLLLAQLIPPRNSG